MSFKMIKKTLKSRYSFPRVNDNLALASQAVKKKPPSLALASARNDTKTARSRDINVQIGLTLGPVQTPYFT